MNSPRVPPRFVPTLTEVVEFEEAQVIDAPLAEPVAYVESPAPIDFSQDLSQPVDVVTSWQDEPMPAQPEQLAQPADPYLQAVAALVSDAPPVLSDAVDSVDQIPAAAVPAVATEDVPAFLLATQPMPVWTPTPADAAASTPPAPAAAPAEIESQNLHQHTTVMDDAALGAMLVEPDVPAAAAQDHVLDTEREEQIVQNVLAELQRRTDLMLEYRLRETLSPILARLCDALIKEARQDLAATLRDVVSRAVAQELGRHRPK